jgi:hypothetical protein
MYSEFGINAALQRVRKASPFCRTIMEHQTGEDVGVTGEGRPDWNPPEAGVAWAIYEQAVYDTNKTRGKGKIAKMNNEETISAWHTADTGNITTSSGKVINLFDLLGINPEYARDTMRRVPLAYEMLTERGEVFS